MPVDRRSRLLPILAALVVIFWTSGVHAGTNGYWFLPDAERLSQYSIALQIAFIIFGTLISEDLVCIFIGVLIANHQMDWRVGGAGCFLGIYIGDLLFFFLGRAGGKRLIQMKFFSRGFGPERLASFGDWFDKRPWAAIAMCRILPGLRVPLYLAVGGLTKRTGAFFFWTAFFAFVWTPAIIALVALLGDAFTEPFKRLTGSIGWAMVLAVVAIYLVVRFVILMTTLEGRQKLANWFGFLWGRRRSKEAATPKDALVQE